MQRRSSERVSVNINVRFCCEDRGYSGTVRNLSENGMFISTRDMRFPFDTNFKVLIPVEDYVLTVPVKVSRITKTSDSYDGIAVELLNPPTKDYLKFIEFLKSALE
ncbi:MAG: PilZ domain-containing protein [Deferribacteres bacterium]|nr:PilZ domain-containing protein [Deferribacteres bacterium]